ncbi:LemA family protein [Candidatus Kaiserbacteria bacterium]|nr:LemA family protein [Candidatus Kaiserbacteria bacterium]
MTLLYILLAVLVILVLYAIFVYNRFVSLGKRSEEAWADIDVQLKRRYDLIPNLVETVKGYAAHEQKTLAEVTEMRTRAMNATAPHEKAEAENMLSGALKTLFAVSENYPDLKANQNFLELQRELTDTEDKIQAARRFYNGNVRDLGIALQTFPSNIIAGMFGFSGREYFELGEGEGAAREPVKVSF